MQTRHLISSAALALLFCAGGAFAADGCRTVANGVQKCDVRSGQESTRDQVVAEIHAPADNTTGCRTVANGVQKCDVATGRESSRAEVVAQLHATHDDALDGCRTVANGVQKCDLPTPYAPRRDTAIATAR
jgi:hypothetical protein